MKKIFLLFTFCFLLLVSNPVSAQQTDYTLLAPIPLSGAQSGDSQTAKASDYIKGIFMLTIAIATGLAVIMIIFGGIKYMSTDAFTGKSEAKTIIEHALCGLLLAISAWLILNTINTNLTDFNLQITPQPIPASTPGTGLTNCDPTINRCGVESPALQVFLANLAAPFNIMPRTTTGGAHNPGSCHFGGTCADGGHAVDFGRNALPTGRTLQDALNAGQTAGGACRCELNGGGTVSCSDPAATHVHCNVNTASCGCN